MDTLGIREIHGYVGIWEICGDTLRYMDIHGGKRDM